jgi:hypothetical protein
MGKDKLLPLIALLVLLLGSISTAYVYTTTTSTGTISINGTEYTLDQLMFLGEDRVIGDYNGGSLDQIIVKSGVPVPENHEYTLIAADGYQKTVQWDNMKNGLITDEGQTIFSDLPKAFWVKDIIEIKVE